MTKIQNCLVISESSLEIVSNFDRRLGFVYAMLAFPSKNKYNLSFRAKKI